MPPPAPTPPPQPSSWPATAWRWLIGLVSWALLSALAAQSLASSVFGADAGPDLVTIQVPGGDVRVRRLLADGVLLSRGEYLTQGEWSEVDDDPGHPELVHRGGEPAAVFFQARHALVNVAPGSVQLLRGYPGSVVDQVGPGGPPPDAGGSWLCAPSVRAPDWWPWVCALGAALPLVLLRPWRSTAGLDRWLTCHLVAVHGLTWLTQWVGANEDFGAYLRSWELNRLGQPFNHPPAYGAFLVLAQNVPGLPGGHVVTLVQHALLVTTLLWVWRMIRRFAPPELGQAWLLLTSVLPPTLLLPQMVQSENLAVFALAGTVWFSLRAAESWTRTRAAAAAACLAVGILARGVPAVAAASVLLLHVAGRPLRVGVWRAAAIVGTALLPVLGVMAWIGAHSGQFAIATGMGRHLYSRVVNEQRLVDEAGPAFARLRALLPDVDPRSRYYWELAPRLEQQGVSYAEVNELFGEAALEGIRSAPLAYLSFSFALAWRNLMADPCHYLVAWARNRPPAAWRPPPVLAPRVPELAWRRALDRAFGAAWPPLCWLALLGVACAAWSRRGALVLALAWLPAGYLLGAGFLEFFLPRYNVAVTPFVTAVAVVPLALLWRALGRFRRTR